MLQLEVKSEPAELKAALLGSGKKCDDQRSSQGSFEHADAV
jgi:hypothetical protein